MNRQSALVFADFNNFESPRGSRSQRGRESDDDNEDDDGQQGFYMTQAWSSTNTSTYTLEKALPEPPYHVFTLPKKKQLVYIVSLAGLFSPLSSNIYFPALGEIAKDLKVSLSLVSLTVTVYMIVQGIAPSFWGPLSDTKGRRITFIGTFVVYLVANIGLAFSNNFTALMVFRGIQAAGSAATISVGAGVIGDITTARERGGLIGIFGGIRMLGQSLGPVIGGIISQYLGYHAIFWFLFGLGSLALFLIILLLPETLRSIAGNGTIPLTSIHRPLIYTQPPYPPRQDQVCTPHRKMTISSIVAPLKFLFEKDVFITLFFGSIVYTVWSMVTSSTTALFQNRFNLNDLQVGLVFLPNGAGCVAGSYLTGHLMDHDYKTIETRYRNEKNLHPNTPLNKKELVDFPIEESRLRNIWWIVLLFIISTAIYGFSLNLNILAIPLILQFFIAYTATAVFSLNSALVIDLYPGASASATAVNNLMRCSVGAAGVAAVQIVIDGIGEGTTFAVFAGVTAACSPLLVVEWYFGGRWRNERRERLRRVEEARRDRGLEKLVG
ncbi:major facilitator superfamily domain-containing protein [Rhexocercosporidium sp. MPI-PUGE-AT-0058]|nr:major facilitator superfamily domain-containing protein [Rhexocercosporidium sp. MPI-PUGE-AT-0058]